jgi:hypothetical protein
VADIKIPGEELEKAHGDLEKVLTLLEAGGRPLDLDGALGGAADVLGAAQAFDDRWKDGRWVISQDGRELQKKVRQVLDAFQKTDDDLTADM